MAAFLAAVQIDSNPFRKKGATATDPEALYRALMGHTSSAAKPLTPDAERARLRDRFDLDDRFPHLFNSEPATA